MNDENEEFIRGKRLIDPVTGRVEGEDEVVEEEDEDERIGRGDEDDEDDSFE